MGEQIKPKTSIHPTPVLFPKLFLMGGGSNKAQTSIHHQSCRVEPEGSEHGKNLETDFEAKGEKEESKENFGSAPEIQSLLDGGEKRGIFILVFMFLNHKSQHQTKSFHRATAFDRQKELFSTWEWLIQTNKKKIMTLYADCHHETYLGDTITSYLNSEEFFLSF